MFAIPSNSKEFVGGGVPESGMLCSRRKAFSSTTVICHPREREFLIDQPYTQAHTLPASARSISLNR